MVEAEAAWTLREVADWCGHSIEVVRDWRDGPTVGFPQPVGRRSNAFVYDPDQVRAWWAARELGDERWTILRVTAELGVSESLVRTARRKGRLPPPDGVLRGRPWWYSDTVRAWWASRHVPAGAWVLDQVLEHTGLTKHAVTAAGRVQLPEQDGTAVVGRQWVRWWWPDTVRAWWAVQRAGTAVRTSWDLAAVARQIGRTEQSTRDLVAAGDLPAPIADSVPPRWQPAAVRTAWRAFLARHRDRGVLFGQDVAAVTGLSWDSVRTYRRLGKLPEPDGWEIRRPWWHEDTISKWDRDRRAIRKGRPRLSDPRS